MKRLDMMGRGWDALAVAILIAGLIWGLIGMLERHP
jgi:hypothetical protein